MAYIEFKNICKEYENDEIKTKVLKKINFEIEKGELVVITGPSLSGKTACLNILSGTEASSSGELIVNNLKINELKGRKLTKYRRGTIGYVFQDYELVENLTVSENISLGAEVCKNKTDINTLIKKVGLTKVKDSFPFQLSNDEKKRVAIATMIAKEPDILLCDEPINALTNKNAKQILKFIQTIVKKNKKTVIIATNNNLITPIANKVITFKNGSVLNIKKNKKPKSVGDLSW